MRRFPHVRSLAIAPVALAFSCGPETPTVAPQPVATAPAAAVAPAFALTADALRAHVEALSADAMEGRRPGTPGATKAVEYIEFQMEAIGLEPAGDNGTYRQTVPMRAVKTDVAASTMALTGKGDRKAEWTFGTDWVGTSFAAELSRSFDAPIVFAGYGASAPEYAWEDYDADVKGKVVLVFVGDPPVDDGRFGGAAMTYYGRWTYKYERALAAGAAACLVIHETEAASYGWNVPRTSYSGERFAVAEADGSAPPALGLQGWISSEAADALAKANGASLAQWHELAMAPEFTIVDTGARLKGTMTTTDRRVQDVNVLGVLPGTTRADEALFLTAHWDHLGIDDGEGIDGDKIYNGAIDNASGIASMLGTAATLAETGRLERSIVFFATTAEEQGLLGSKYYAAHPLWPVPKIAGLINLDSVNVHGPTAEVEIVGKGQTTLEDHLTLVAEAQHRTVIGDSRPEAGSYYRSDHFPFAKIGVPALYFHAGLDMIDGGRAAGDAIAAQRKAVYHTPLDAFDPEWSFGGALQDVQLVTAILRRVSRRDEMPHFKDGSEFKATER